VLSPAVRSRPPPAASASGRSASGSLTMSEC
jgi:hypothetical protein